jgi:type III pantothenate kinase
VVNNGVTGLIVPVGDQAALAKAILSLLKDPKIRDVMGTMARKRILELFAMNLVTEQYIALYADLVQQVHPR